ncbi:hypothetical protein ALT785_270121 [Alteromonas infernus]
MCLLHTCLRPHILKLRTGLNMNPIQQASNYDKITKQDRHVWD